MNEETAVLTGSRKGQVWFGRLREWKSGTPVRVDFDWDWVLRREEQRRDILGFYHTHPPGVPGPSIRDVRTMQAWVSCLGKPLLCIVREGKGLSAHLFRTDEERGRLLPEVQQFERGVIVAIEG